MSQLYQLTKDAPEMGLKKGQRVFVSDIESHPHKSSLKLVSPDKKTAKQAKVETNAN